MDTVKLGAQGLEVSRQGLGCMGMSEFYGASNEGEAIATIHRAIELGVTFLDTADMYGVGRNEELVKGADARRAQPGNAVRIPAPRHAYIVRHASDVILRAGDRVEQRAASLRHALHRGCTRLC